MQQGNLRAGEIQGLRDTMDRSVTRSTRGKQDSLQNVSQTPTSSGVLTAMNKKIYLQFQVLGWLEARLRLHQHALYAEL